MCTYHPRPQCAHAHEEGHTEQHRGPAARLRQAGKHISVAAAWQTPQQRGEGSCEGVRGRGLAGEQEASQVGVGGQQQDAGQLQGETATGEFLGAASRGPRPMWGLLNALKQHRVCRSAF